MHPQSIVMLLAVMVTAPAWSTKLHEFKEYKTSDECRNAVDAEGDRLCYPGYWCRRVFDAPQKLYVCSEYVVWKTEDACRKTDCLALTPPDRPCMKWPSENRPLYYACPYRGYTSEDKCKKSGCYGGDTCNYFSEVRTWQCSDGYPAKAACDANCPSTRFCYKTKVEELRTQMDQMKFLYWKWKCTESDGQPTLPKCLTSCRQRNTCREEVVYRTTWPTDEVYKIFKCNKDEYISEGACKGNCELNKFCMAPQNSNIYKCTGEGYETKQLCNEHCQPGVCEDYVHLNATFFECYSSQIKYKTEEICSEQCAPDLCKPKLDPDITVMVGKGYVCKPTNNTSPAVTQPKAIRTGPADDNEASTSSVKGTYTLTLLPGASALLLTAHALI